MTTKGNKVKGYNEWKPPHTLECFQELREEKDAFFVFVQRFVRPTFSSVWKKGQHEATGISSIVTVTDEAFALLVLENNWERWLDINNKSKNKYVPSKRGRGDRAASDILPLYTNVNCSKVNAGNGGNRGWNETGINRFNELCYMVKEDRNKNSMVDKETFKRLQPRSETKRSRKRARLSESNVKAYTDIPIDGRHSSDEDSEESSDSDSND